MTRLSDAELAQAYKFAEGRLELTAKEHLQHDKVALALLQLRDDLDAVTKERDFAIRGDVSLDLTFDDDWDCRVRGPWDLKLLNHSYTIYTGDTPLDALRKALAAHAPTPEGST